MEDDPPQRARKWVEGMSKGLDKELDGLILGGLQIEKCEKGLIRCNFTIPPHLSDKNGDWHVGAIATLIDDIGAATVISSAGNIKGTVDLSISYYSTAKIQEKVEIEGKVVGQRGQVMSAAVEVKKKENGEMIALGRVWMMTTVYERHSQASKL
ncbi:unnamed protein product [Ilex paraguariensis]|uniref:Acyl-coenzyme A thioesterase 13 n=1 Tax=Ilex paraguariensis TaxID=185542 RepID=A0ABC8TYJ8_9AQUA